ncbi:MAG: 5,6-dimethylbenzimidazole synthase [Acidobacteria bacterium]|nr:5,6-dimethylbenzimidazole synthase [Acidobacteriota bacterium]
MTEHSKPPVGEFTEAEKRGLYRAIYERRDVRDHFLSTPIADEVLRKLLEAAHHAGSVGFMQPWSFIVVRSPEVKQGVKALFEQANATASEAFEGERRALYSRMKLEGICEAPVNLCVTCDPTRNGPHVLGRHTIRETDVYSTCCAVQNLWLAARAEGIGVGWVSIFDPRELRALLRIPAHILLVSYLCLGYVTEFLSRPQLETTGWQSRLLIDELIFDDYWGEQHGR